MSSSSSASPRSVGLVFLPPCALPCRSPVARIWGSPSPTRGWQFSLQRSGLLGAQPPQPALGMTLGLPCPWGQGDVFHSAEAQPLKLCAAVAPPPGLLPAVGAVRAAFPYTVTGWPLAFLFPRVIKKKKSQFPPSCPEGSNAEILLRDQKLAAPEIKGNIKVKCLKKDSPGLVLSAGR